MLEAFIELNCQRTKDNEQVGREADTLKMIERERAKRRQAEQTKQHQPQVKKANGGKSLIKETRGACQALHQTSVLRLSIVPLMAAINILDRPRQFVSLGVVERPNRDGIKSASQRCVIPPREDADAARLAEVVMQGGVGLAGRRPLIVGQSVIPCDQANVIGFHDHEPRARFGANGAVAPSGALAEIEVRLEADGAAMTAS
jgi:hypothetical protein